jgi:hypothetical protein
MQIQWPALQAAKHAAPQVSANQASIQAKEQTACAASPRAPGVRPINIYICASQEQHISQSTGGVSATPPRPWQNAKQGEPGSLPVSSEGGCLSLCLLESQSRRLLRTRGAEARAQLSSARHTLCSAPWPCTPGPGVPNPQAGLREDGLQLRQLQRRQARREGDAEAHAQVAPPAAPRARHPLPAHQQLRLGRDHARGRHLPRAHADSRRALEQHTFN